MLKKEDLWQSFVKVRDDVAGVGQPADFQGCREGQETSATVAFSRRQSEDGDE